MGIPKRLARILTRVIPFFTTYLLSPCRPYPSQAARHFAHALLLVSLNGVVWFTKLTQMEDGTLTKYEPSTDTYSFQVTFQKVLGDIWSSQRTLYGTISPSHGFATLSIP